MSRGEKGEETLSQAHALEKEYGWLKATKLYEQALSLVGKKDLLRKGEIQEHIGYCFFKAAFQADSRKKFREKMQRAVGAYEKARATYEKLTDEQKAARMFRCDATIAYVGHWLEPEASEKKQLLDECWRLTKEALKAFKKAGQALEYGKTYNQFSLAAFLAYALEWDFQTSEKVIKEAMELGEQAVKLLSSVDDSDELARALVKAAFYLGLYGYCFTPGMDEKQRYYQKGQGYWKKACKLSEEAALLELSSTSCSYGDEFGWGFDEIIVNFEEALSRAKKTEDNFMIGTALDWLVYASVWKAFEIDDPDRRGEALQRTLQYAEGAKQHFSSISFVSPRGAAAWTGDPQSWYYWLLGRWEADLRKKRDLLENALMYGTQALKLAESTGYPQIIFIAHHQLALALEELVNIEANLEEKRRILEESLEHRKEILPIFEQLCVYQYWNLGVARHRFARLKAELSCFEKDSEKRWTALEEATSEMEHALQLMSRDAVSLERMDQIAVFENLGRGQLFYGELLTRLYELTNNRDHQRKAIRAFEEAAESFHKLDLFSKMAESYWKAAGCYDSLDEHSKAAESFTLASTNFVSAAKKIPQLEKLYKDHAGYMQAWAEIEKARHFHTRKEYGKAKEHYAQTADLHKLTERWNYLSPNYSAWAQLEEAEDLSRREQTEQAKNFFQQAAKIFLEAKESIQTKLGKTEAKEEKEMTAELGKASETRRMYCLGRATLEEAKILDRQGNHAASSRKYASASETFQKAVDAMEIEADRRELRPIFYLCRAWEMMTRAEAEASPDFYLEASKLFDEAKEHSLDEKTKMLAMGHSRFCKALEAGTRFEDTREQSLHSAAKRLLESASSYYLKSGFKNASDYARATHRLFDAYMYAHQAETEADPRKKAQYYQMAEKLFQTSAGLYIKAQHPEKSEEVGRLLESIKEERKLAMALTEVLHAPTITSTTTSFSTPTPTHEQAVGLERFEHADVQANLLLKAGEVKVGEDVNIRLELVNAGKAPALLIKVDEIVPGGFEIKEVPEVYTVEDSYLNLKGRRLNPLKTEDVKIVATPRTKGTYVVKPRILYIDETGKYKSHEPEPVTITARELGISGWIKGER